MLRTRPRFRARIPGRNAWVRRTSARMFTSTITSCVSRVLVAKGPTSPRPALLTRNSISSGRACTSRTTRSTSGGLARSAVTTCTEIFLAARSSPASVSSRSRRRATRTRSIPSAAKRRANSSPRPDEAPVTSAARLMTGRTNAPLLGFKATRRTARLPRHSDRRCRHHTFWHPWAPASGKTNHRPALHGQPRDPAPTGRHHRSLARGLERSAFPRGGRAHARRAGGSARRHGPLPELGRAPARSAAGRPRARARPPARRHLAHLRTGLRGPPHHVRPVAALPPPAGARGPGLRGDGAFPDGRDGSDAAGGAAGHDPPEGPAGADLRDGRGAHPGPLLLRPYGHAGPPDAAGTRSSVPPLLRGLHGAGRRLRALAARALHGRRAGGAVLRLRQPRAGARPASRDAAVRRELIGVGPSELAGHEHAERILAVVAEGPASPEAGALVQSQRRNERRRRSGLDPQAPEPTRSGLGREVLEHRSPDPLAQERVRHPHRLELAAVRIQDFQSPTPGEVLAHPDGPESDS